MEIPAMPPFRSNIQCPDMTKNLKLSLLLLLTFLFFLFFFFFLFWPKQGTPTLPASYYAYPMDSTVQVVQNISSKVNESSGIVFLEDKIWTHNDSGDEPYIYQVSPESGDVLRTVSLKEADSRDWEDIAIDTNFLFVGDFGNNGGKRRDLAIYRINRADLAGEKESVDAFKMDFTYPDRVDYNPPAYGHNFDCEAMISVSDSVFLFSKNHQDKHCRLYVLENDLPEQTAQIRDRIDTEGMITGAGIAIEKGVLALVGYNFNPQAGHFGPFVWFFWDYPNNHFFKGKRKRVNLPVFAQTEGICYWKDLKFLISSEKSGMTDGKLMVIDAEQWVNEEEE